MMETVKFRRQHGGNASVFGPEIYLPCLSPKHWCVKLEWHTWPSSSL